MTEPMTEPMTEAQLLNPPRFTDPDITAKGQRRASVTLRQLHTLWFNTGTVCNIECRNCYTESSPGNDRLAFMTAAEVAGFLDEVADLGLGTREIGFTGGEPFVNPELLEMLELALGGGFEVLVLTNAMQPMMRPRMRERLLRLGRKYGDRLALRVSLDHYTQELHEIERGPGTWTHALNGARWLASEGFRLTIAGRTCWQEDEATARAGYTSLFAAHNLPVDATDPARLVLFPEMDEEAEVPEITTGCWDILGVDPAAMMCASGRMIVKRRGASRPVVLACTLLPYDQQFEMGDSLASARDTVKLNHPHCARFCVLGGASCSVA